MSRVPGPSKHKCKCQLLRSRLRAKRRQLKKVVKENTVLHSNIKHVFSDDQIEALSRTSSRGYEWSSETIQRALQLRFSCGSRGYDALLKQGYPLPSLRTLRRRLE